MEILTIAQRKYEKRNLLTFGLTVNINADGQKHLTNLEGWTNDDRTIRPCHNALGIVCGRKNNIFVLDIDNPEKFKRLLSKLGVEEPKTWTQHTGNGHKHYIFRWTPDLPTGRYNAIGNGIETKSDGHMIILAPTIVKDKIYVWDPNFSPETLEYPMPVPGWLKLALSSYSVIGDL